MNKTNNKGLTLLELLVALAIFTTVIFIGYKIIDKSIIAIKEQGEINKGQLTMNNMNEYLTKDLEQSTSIKFLLEGRTIADTREVQEDSEDKDILSESYNKEVKPKIDDLIGGKSSEKLNYKYIIRDGYDKDDSKKYIEYNVNIEKKNSRVMFSVSRKDKSGVSIDIVNNGVLKENEVPFNITGNSPYKVIIGYNKGKDFQKHEFEVTSRYFVTEITDSDSGNEIDPPIPPVLPSGYDSIGYWTANIERQKTKNLYSWINNDLSNPGNQDKIKNGQYFEKFNIRGKNEEHGNSGHTWANIGYPNDILASNEKQETIKPADIRNIYIYVSKGATLWDVKDNITNSDKTISGIKGEEEGPNGYKLEGGGEGRLYECTLYDKDKNDKRVFDITGSLSIDKETVDTGFAMILYDSGNNLEEDLVNGDLVFEYIKSGETQNNGEYNWVKNIKYNMLSQNIKSQGNQNKHGEYREGINVFLDKMNGIIRAHSGGNPTAEIKDEMIKKVVGIKIKLEGNIMISNFSFPGYENQDLINNKVYEFKGLPIQQHNINGEVIIHQNSIIGDMNKIIIDFIYE